MTNTSSRHPSYTVFLKVLQLSFSFFFFLMVVFNAITVLSFALSVNVPAQLLLSFSCTHVVKPEQHAGGNVGHIQHMLSYVWTHQRSTPQPLSGKHRS